MARMETRRRTWLQRLLERLLVPRVGRVRAKQEANHLEGVLRFAALFAATIMLPSLLLAYFGVGSIRYQELTVIADMEGEASAVADRVWARTDRRFSAFEDAVRDRLEAGRSPLESRGELHPHLLVALRFHEGGQLVAPFQARDSGSTMPLATLFREDLMVAVGAEAAGRKAATVEKLYAAVVEASDAAVEGRARFDQARMLAADGQRKKAMRMMARVAEEFGGLRDPWGVRFGDLARLQGAELQLEVDAEGGIQSLRTLVDELLLVRWTVGQGAEAAVARRALAILETHGERDWAAGARERLTEQSEMLFWAEELGDEISQVVAIRSGLQTAPGELRWHRGARGLWALTHWDGDTYVFGIDLETELAALKAEARNELRPDSRIAAWIAGPTDIIPDDLLVRKNLAPYLMGSSFIVVPADAGALDELLSSQRRRQLGIIGLSTAMLVVGVFLTVRLVTRELGFARMKTDFAANVSHELRSPITQIRVKGEALMLGLMETEDEQALAHQAIVRESERLSRLVDNVLDFSAIERGAKSYDLREDDLVGTVMRAVDAIADAQELLDKDLDVSLPAHLPAVPHDPDAVIQCIINLVSNAAKYSEPGTWVRIRGREVEGGVEITVSDQGIGIVPSELRQIFEPFFRSEDRAARTRKGTGIGLTITRYIMDMHGGVVSVQSRPGVGSSFTLRFPWPGQSSTAGPDIGDNRST